MKKIFNVLLIFTFIFLITGCHVDLSEKQDGVKKTYDNVDENLGPLMELGIDKITLNNNGELILDLGEKLKPLGDDITIATDAKDVYLLEYGNGGYRIILFIKNDNTISCVNSVALIEEGRIEITDNLGNYKNVKSLQSETDQSGTIINAVLENGEKHMLDKYLK